MYSFPNLEPVCCSRSSSNCCLLSSIWIAQEAVKVVWYSHLLNFPQFVVIYKVKDFGIINKAVINQVDVFLEFSCFLYDPMDVGNLTSGFSVFLNPARVSRSSRFTYCSSLTWRILSITLLVCEMSANVR